MAFLTDEEQKPWDPFARAKQTESVEPDAGPEPTYSWGSGAHGRPSAAAGDPDAQMDRLLRGHWEWLKHGISPMPAYDRNMGIEPPTS